MGFGLTMRYPVYGHKCVVSVDMHLISREFGAWDTYEVLSLKIVDGDERIVENTALPSIFLGISWSHYIRLLFKMLCGGGEYVARLLRCVFFQMYKMWQCEVLVRLR